MTRVRHLRRHHLHHKHRREGASLISDFEPHYPLSDPPTSPRSIESFAVEGSPVGDRSRSRSRENARSAKRTKHKNKHKKRARSPSSSSPSSSGSPQSGSWKHQPKRRRDSSPLNEDKLLRSMEGRIQGLIARALDVRPPPVLPRKSCLFRFHRQYPRTGTSCRSTPRGWSGRMRKFQARQWLRSQIPQSDRWSLYHRFCCPPCRFPKYQVFRGRKWRMRCYSRHRNRPQWA